MFLANSAIHNWLKAAFQYIKHVLTVQPSWEGWTWSRIHHQLQANFISNIFVSKYQTVEDCYKVRCALNWHKVSKEHEAVCGEQFSIIAWLIYSVQCGSVLVLIFVVQHPSLTDDMSKNHKKNMKNMAGNGVGFVICVLLRFQPLHSPRHNPSCWFIPAACSDCNERLAHWDNRTQIGCLNSTASF